MDKLYIIIPAYNEEENIETVIKDWYPVVEGHNGNMESRLVIVNDGSKDRTLEMINGMKKDRPLLLALDKENGGHGGAILYGYDYALLNNADYIFQTDSDGQTLPSEFEAFWKCRNDYDMVIGSREDRKDGVSRIIVTRTLRLVIRVCFKVFVRDANTPYRLMKAETLRRYIDLIPKDFFLSNVLISVIFIKKKRSVKYIPITFRPRQGGVNSINMKKIFKVGRKALGDFFRLNRVIEESRP